MFSTTKLFFAPPELIGKAGEDVAAAFQAEGYEVDSQTLLSGGVDISLARGGLFKAALGMRSALKVSLTPCDGKILAEASVGIFGQHVIPSVILWYVFWPALLLQAWGMVRQAKLDDRVMELVAESLARHGVAQPTTTASPAAKTCACGQELRENARFCNACGKKAPGQDEAQNGSGEPCP